MIRIEERKDIGKQLIRELNDRLIIKEIELEILKIKEEIKKLEGVRY